MVERARAERAIADFLDALGYDPNDPELKGTPARVASAFIDELLVGRDASVDDELRGACGTGDATDDIVVVRDISVSTVCPHHLMPAVGRCTVAYLPGGQLVGIGTLARVVHAFARRLTLQEQIGHEVTAALTRALGVRAAYCSLELSHSCLSARGSREAAATVRTVSITGAFRKNEGLELLRLSLGG